MVNLSHDGLFKSVRLAAAESTLPPITFSVQIQHRCAMMSEYHRGVDKSAQCLSSWTVTI